ncbi:YfgM family protein [Massilia sp. S19_KUP03_FR1]|uniref:YfgM family protein n=1 Tax=Massilia sp. S19_KUP03_FR1 TaxID=3025503 RepID=UPI002FCD1717
MAYDLEEQEQLASLKAFWAKYGNVLSWVVIAALASYAGYNYWNAHVRAQSTEASGLYDELLVSVAAKDNVKAQRITTDIKDKYGSTAYAEMAAMGAAKTAFDANDLKTAKVQLQWVIDHGDDAYQAIARLRLAGVLLDEKAYDEALKLVAAVSAPQYAGLAADRKGDILAAQNKLADARTAYLAALSAMDKRDPGRQLVAFKLESIGGTAPVETAPAA